MKTRVITSVVGVLLLVLVFFFYNTVLFNLLFAAVCLVAIHEIFNAFGFKKQDSYLYIGFVLPVILVFLLPVFGLQKWITTVLFALLLYLALCFVRKSKHIDFAKLGGMTVFSLVVLFCFFSLTSLKTLLPAAEYGEDAVYCTVMVMGYAWGGDTFAYLVGRRFGRHKLAPNVSPNKTVEGAVGGVLGSMLLGFVISFLYTQFWQVGPLWNEGDGGSYLAVVLLGIPAAVLGMLGDLFASAVKRQCKLKDYGTIFPGHGGILDRFDSLLFIAPLMALAVQVYHLL